MPRLRTRITLPWIVIGLIALALALPASVLAGAPTADDKTPTVLEDTTTQITLSGADADGDTLTFSIASGPTSGTLGNFGSPACDGQTPSSCTETVDYTPNANVNGPDSFTYTTNDGTTDSAAATVSIAITAVNDQPSFSDGGDKSGNEDAAASFPNWATSIDPGGGSDESGQVIHFDVSNVQVPSLFSAGPAVSASGTLTWTPATNANGSSTIEVTAVDNGGTSNGGVNTSTVHQVTITVTAVNDAPSFFAGSDEAVDEDSGAASFPGWATSPSAGPSDESGQTLSYLISSNTNPGLFSVAPAVATNGTLTFTSAANRFGTATVGVEIHDSGGTANGGIDTSTGQAFTITVNPVDDPPNAVNDTGYVVPENAPATSVNVLANDTYLPDAPETLTIVAVTQGAHGTVAITAGGTGLTYEPAAEFVGTDQFSYTIQDSGGTLQDSAQVALSVGKDLIGPVDNSPVVTLRKGTTLGSTVGVHITWSATDAGVGVGRYLLQQSVDGGAYTTITLPTALTTAIDRSLTVGHFYQYRMRAYDKNNNPGTLKYTAKFQVLTYQQSGSLIKYAGTWTTVSNASDSAGSAKYTYAANATATFTTTGSDFAIVGPMNSFRGSAWVYVDGVFKSSITEHTSSATTLYRQVLWTIHFSSSGSHVIQVKVTGSGRFDLDCFVMLR